MRDYAKCLGFDDRLFRAIGIPLLAFIIPPVFYGEWLPGVDKYFEGFLFTLVNWEGNRGIFIFVNRRYPKIDQWRQRVTWLLLLCIAYTAVACTLLNAGLTFIGYDMSESIKQEDPIRGFGVSYLLVLAIGSVYQSVYFFTLWKEATFEKEELERAHLSSQLEGLRNQVNPHFLFNSLNTLSYLIPEDGPKAVRFVQKLSKVYRYVLESREDKLIPIQQELEFLDSYIFLQKERFGDNLKVDCGGLDKHGGIAIVPLTLQMLFENAIKHNIISSEMPLTIEVFIESNKLIVRNNLQRKNQVMDSTGVGLKNIKDRYRILTEKEVDIIVSQEYFTVIIPLIPLEVKKVASPN